MMHCICRFRWTTTLWVLGLLGAAALAGCGPGPSSAHRTLALTECRLPKLAAAAQCGAIEVPENRSQPGGRMLRIAVAVLPANTLNPAPDPLFILAGGPGQAASYLGPFAAQLTEVRKNRDLVLVDQRGTGRSSPLTCAAFKPDQELDTALELDPVPRARSCVEELRAAGVDPAQYTTAAWIADLDAVRAALGYDRINLWGGSYGTRAAQEYLRRYPGHVRAVVLDGVAPPAMKISLDVWATRDAAIDAVFAACAASPSCHRAHPDLAAELQRAEERLDQAPTTRVDDPRTGTTRALHLTRNHLIGGLQPLVYVPELASLMPEVIGRAAHGDLGPLLATASLVTGEIADQLNSALYYSVTCTEDVPRISAQERVARLRGVRAALLAERGLAVCDVWPHGKADPQAATPVVSDTPVLLLSGGLDPVTPPAYGTEVAKTLSHSRHIVAAGYGHNVTPHACGPHLLAAFLEDPSFGSLPADCVNYFQHSKRPPLWPDRQGPQP